MSRVGDSCQYCGFDNFMLSDESRQGNDVRICLECHKPYDQASIDTLEARYMQECFEDNNVCE